MRKIKKDDEVIILSGKDKGKRGKVLKVLVSKIDPDNIRVLVEGVALMKKHTRGNPQAGQPGGIIEKESSIHISKTAIYNPITKKADRVGFKMLENGDKVRIFKSNGEVVDI